MVSYAIGFHLLSKLLQGNMFCKIQLVIYVDGEKDSIHALFSCQHVKKVWQQIYPLMASISSEQKNFGLPSFLYKAEVFRYGFERSFYKYLEIMVY